MYAINSFLSLILLAMTRCTILQNMTLWSAKYFCKLCMTLMANVSLPFQHYPSPSSSSSSHFYKLNFSVQTKKMQQIILRTTRLLIDCSTFVSFCSSCKTDILLYFFLLVCAHVCVCIYVCVVFEYICLCVYVCVHKYIYIYKYM